MPSTRSWPQPLPEKAHCALACVCFTEIVLQAVLSICASDSLFALDWVAP